MQANANSAKVLEHEKMVDDGVGNTKLPDAACEFIRAHNMTLIDDAIENLTQALELRPAYSEAMQYLNLVYRRRAECDCGDPPTRAADLKLAVEWNEKATQARQKPTTAPSSAAK